MEGKKILVQDLTDRKTTEIILIKTKFLHTLHLTEMSPPSHDFILAPKLEEFVYLF